MELSKIVKKSGMFWCSFGFILASVFWNLFFLSNFKQETPVPIVQEVAQEKIVVTPPCATPTPIVEEPLTAPLFLKDLPESLKTNTEGEVKVAWTPVARAKKYQIILRSKTGKKVKIWRTSKSVIYLKEVPFDEDKDFTPYNMTIQAFDEKDTPGPESAPRELLARKMKEIMAPTIKGISVED